jgi:hypothetical protein
MLKFHPIDYHFLEQKEIQMGNGFLWAQKPSIPLLSLCLWMRFMDRKKLDRFSFILKKWPKKTSQKVNFLLKMNYIGYLDNIMYCSDPFFDNLKSWGIFLAFQVFYQQKIYFDDWLEFRELYWDVMRVFDFPDYENVFFQKDFEDMREKLRCYLIEKENILKTYKNQWDFLVNN